MENYQFAGNYLKGITSCLRITATSYYLGFQVLLGNYESQVDDGSR